MNLYDKILKLQFNEKIGVNDFLDKTGFSKGMYYDIKNGKKKELKPSQSKILTECYPNSSDLWSVKNSVFDKKELSGPKTIAITSLKTLEDVSNFVIDNEDKMMSVNYFKYWLKDLITKDRSLA